MFLESALEPAGLESIHENPGPQVQPAASPVSTQAAAMSQLGTHSLPTVVSEP
jgi:hypothetical protein